MKTKQFRIAVWALVFCQLLTPSAFSDQLIYTDSPVSRDTLDKITNQGRSRLGMPALQSSFEFLKGHPVSLDFKKSLLNILSEADELSFQGNFQQSLEAYEALLIKLQTIPNVAGIESIRSRCHVRIAELKGLLKRPDAALAWRDALAWDATLEGSEGELSPETIQNLKSIQDNVRTDVVIKAPPDSIVYLNGKLGKEVWGKHTFKSRRGSSQVSVLAPGLGWEQREIEIGSEPVSISMAGRKMIDGRCDSARALDQSSSMTFVAYLQEQACFVKIQAGQAAPLAQPLRLPLSPGKETGARSLSAQQSQYFSDSTPSMWKSPWLWLGVGTLAGAIIMISESQKKERVVVPSHGFQF